MNYSIKVRAQAQPKIISGEEIVRTSVWLDSFKKVSDLKVGDEFIYNGGRYDVEDIQAV
jgi:hypothetical protein